MYTHRTRIPRLLRVRNYLNNYFALYKRLTRSRIHADLAFPAYLGFGIIYIIILAMYTRLTRSRIRVELVSPAYLGLGII